MKYVKVVFLKDIGAFVGRDGKIYGPYAPGDEDFIPEEDARELSLRGAVAVVGGYTIEPSKPTPIAPKEPLRPWSSPFLLLWLGVALTVVGFTIMAFSAATPTQGFIWIFPLPPMQISGPEAILLITLPIIFTLAIMAIFMYMFLKS